MAIIPIQINNYNYNTDKQLHLALREKSFRYQEICQTNKACQLNFDEINTETYYRSGIIYTNTICRLESYAFCYYFLKFSGFPIRIRRKVRFYELCYSDTVTRYFVTLQFSNFVLGILYYQVYAIQKQPFSKHGGWSS